MRRSSGAVVCDLEFTWQRVVLGPGAATRHHPYLHSSRDQRYEPAGASGGSPHTTIAMSTAAVDPVSGVVTDRTVTVVEGPGGTAPGASRSERVEYASVLNDTVNWCLGRPQSVALTGSHTLPGGAAVTRRAALAWDGLGCRPVRLQLEPGSPQSVRHVMTILDGGALVSIHGKRLRCAPGSICVHGDNAEAVATAHAVREALNAAGWEPVPLPALNG